MNDRTPREIKDWSELPDVELLTEVRFPAIYHLLTSDAAVGVITAFSDALEQETVRNVAKNHVLSATIRNAGFGFSWVDCSWLDNAQVAAQGLQAGVAGEEQTEPDANKNSKPVAETFLLVSAPPEKSQYLYQTLLQAAREHEQKAFVFKPGNERMIKVLSRDGSVHQTFKQVRLDEIIETLSKLRHGVVDGRKLMVSEVRRPLGFMGKMVERTRGGRNPLLNT